MKAAVAMAMVLMHMHAVDNSDFLKLFKWICTLGKKLKNGNDRLQKEVTYTKLLTHYIIIHTKLSKASL